MSVLSQHFSKGLVWVVGVFFFLAWRSCYFYNGSVLGCPPKGTVFSADEWLPQQHTKLPFKAFHRPVSRGAVFWPCRSRKSSRSKYLMINVSNKPGWARMLSRFRMSVSFQQGFAVFEGGFFVGEFNFNKCTLEQTGLISDLMLLAVQSLILKCHWPRNLCCLVTGVGYRRALLSGKHPHNS